MIGCIIQTRIGSTRLPGKTLMKLNEHFSTLDFVINQLSFSKLIEKTIIATTTLEQDDVIEKYCRKLNIPCFRGNSDDVLDRYYQCANFFKINHILRITSDCPLIDPEIVDKIIMKYQSGNYDYFTNTLTRTFPVGTDAEIFSFNTLKKSWENAKLPSEREHVTPFIRNRKMNFDLGNLEHTIDSSCLWRDEHGGVVPEYQMSVTGRYIRKMPRGDRCVKSIKISYSSNEVLMNSKNE